jgi:hypothetical protein
LNRDHHPLQQGAENAIGAFDYGSLPPEIAEDLRLDAGRIRDFRDVTGGVHVIGWLLTWAKEALSHGQFIGWVRAECGFSIRTAENYIRGSKFIESTDSQSIAILPPGTLYLISAKNAPPEIVEAVLARAAGGEPVPAAEVKRMLREFKDRNRQGTQGKGRLEMSLREREQAKNEMARENARAIVKRLGRDGAAFILEMRDNILEALPFLEREIGVADRTHQGETA